MPDYALGLVTQPHPTPDAPLSVQGAFPAWLRGTLLRNGPAQFEGGTRPFRHWFDGLAMLHRFAFAEGQVRYASATLHTRERAAADAGQPGLRQFATDPCGQRFARWLALFAPNITDNANISISAWANRVVAMTERPMAIAFDPATLATLGPTPPDAATRALHSSTAHPIVDAARAEQVNFGARFGPRCHYRVFTTDAHGRRTLRARVAVAEPGYMHSFGLSAKSVVLVEQPLVVHPLTLLTSGRPFIDNYRWDPARGTRFLVLDRDDGTLRASYTADAFFTFHVINAHDLPGGGIAIDVCAYDDPYPIAAFHLDALRHRTPDRPLAGQVRRYTMTPGAATATMTLLSDALIELPRLDEPATIGAPATTIYGVGVDPTAPPAFADRIVRVNAATGDWRAWHAPGCTPGEPVFVARPGAAPGEGLLLSVVLDAGAGTSFLLALDAGTLDEVARAVAPRVIPLGFHGDYLPA